MRTKSQLAVYRNNTHRGAECGIIRTKETPMKRIILAMAFLGIISACVLTADGAGIGAIGMPAL